MRRVDCFDAIGLLGFIATVGCAALILAIGNDHANCESNLGATVSPPPPLLSATVIGSSSPPEAPSPAPSPSPLPSPPTPAPPSPPAPRATTSHAAAAADSAGQPAVPISARRRSAPTSDGCSASGAASRRSSTRRVTSILRILPSRCRTSRYSATRRRPSPPSCRMTSTTAYARSITPSTHLVLHSPALSSLDRSRSACGRSASARATGITLCRRSRGLCATSTSSA